MRNKGVGVAVAMWVLAALAALAFWGAVIFVVIHFPAKVW